jgi:5-formyltetrahydrofolate cyclo-ligase
VVDRLAAHKRALRAEARALVPANRETQTRACLAALLALPELRGPGCMAAYAAMGDEVPLERVLGDLRGRGWRVVFPRLEGESLALHEVGLAELVPGAYGLREPAAGTPRVASREVDVFLIPGLLFARDGTRLGRGSGHYDRLLADVRRDALRIGICYAERVRDALPSAPHDEPVHLLVMDRGVLRCRAPADAEEGR